MKLPFRIPSWVWWGTAVLILSGAVVQLWQRPREVIQTRTVTETRTDEHTKQQVDLLTRALVENQQRQQSTEQKLADVATNVRETVYRGNSTDVAALLAQLNSRPAPPTSAPVINVLPASPAPSAPHPTPETGPAAVEGDPGAAPSPMPVAAQPQQVEVIVRSSETVDKSRTEKTASSEAIETGETTVEKTETTDATKTETAKSEAVTKVEKGGSGRDHDARFGVGITSGRQPFASYDLTQLQLGPKAFGLGKLNAGVFLTRSPSVGIDGGPQVNVQPGKGRLFIMGGYQIREQTPVLGVGFKF